MTYQEYLQIYQSKMMDMYRMNARIASLAEKVRDKDQTLTDEATRNKIINAHVATSFLWTGQIQDEKHFNQYMEDLKDLPQLLESPSTDGTVLDLVAKTDEEKEAFRNDVIPVYMMFQPEPVNAVPNANQEPVNAVPNVNQDVVNAVPNVNQDVVNEQQPEPEPERDPAADFVDIDEQQVHDVGAQQYIKQIQSKVKNKKTASIDDIANVLAVRALTDAQRKDASNLLSHTVTYKKSNVRDPNTIGIDQIREYADKIRKDPILNTYLTDRKSQKAIQEALTSGNAGALDDYMKKIFREMPLASYPAQSAFARYMPTVQERIEYLQDKFGKSKDEGAFAYAAAEILVMRNMIKSERDNKKLLNVRLNEEQMKIYNDRVAKLAEDKDFIKLVNDPKNKKALTSGHGGDFIEKIRIDQARKEAAGGNFSENLKNELKENTLQGQLERCAADARNLLMEINTELSNLDNDGKEVKDMRKTWKLVENAQNITARYLATRTQIAKYGNSELIRGMTKDVPWTQQEERLKKVKQSEQYNNMTKNISAAKSKPILTNISTETETLLSDAQNSLKPAAKNAPAQEKEVNEAEPILPAN